MSVVTFREPNDPGQPGDVVFAPALSVGDTWLLNACCG
jgi:hypothetical protein